MSDPAPITVIVRRQARPGQGAALVAALLQRAQDLPSWLPDQRTFRLLQGVTDPDVILYLSEWTSREAYLAAREARNSTGLIPALSAGRVERRICRQLARYEYLGRTHDVITASLIEVPPEAHEQARAFLVTERRAALPTIPGLTLRNLYEDLDVPHVYFVLNGWKSQAARDAFEQSESPAIARRLSELGATLTQLKGYTRLDLDRARLQTAPRAPSDQPD
jgi:heme-degrading monooxygenase HmoA